MNEYDIIHFHNTTDLYSVKNSLTEYKGIILLTCHSPKPYYREVFEDQYTRLQRIFFRSRLKKLEKIAKYAFENCNYIIFPCEDAVEPYDDWLNITKFKSHRYSLFEPPVFMN